MSLAKNRLISILIIFTFIFHLLVPDASACWWKGLPRRSPGVEGGTGQNAGGFNDGKPNQPDDIADEVYLHNGDFVYQHQDLFIPSRGINTEITRTYKSQSRFNGRFGLGWELNYNKRIVPLSNGDLFYLDGEGKRHRFSYVDGANYTSPLEVFDELVQNQAGTYTLTKKDNTKYNFNQDGTLSEIVDRNNNKLTFSYDTQGKLPIIGIPLYYTKGLATPKLIAYQFMLTKIRDTVGRQISFTYDENGRLTKIIDFSGREVAYSYDDLGHLTSVTDPAGNVIQYTYDADRNLRSITDARGNTFLTNTYNPLDQVIAQEYGNDTFYFSYNTENRITDFTDRKGNTRTYYFDENGNPTKIIDPQQNQTIKTYDINNKMLLTSITYPKGNSVFYEYDDKGNLAKITRKPKPDSTEADIITVFTYEPNYNFIKTITDPKGNVTTHNYDTKGNLTKITYPTVGVVTPKTNFTYNAYGQVETVTDSNGITTKYEYYPETRYLKKTINAYNTQNQTTTQMTYDDVGNVTSVTDARGNTINSSYNVINQLIQTTSSAPFNYVTKYTYDKNGNLKQVDRETGDLLNSWQTTTYTYTILDKLKTITDYLGNVTTFSYDANDNRISIRDAEGNATTYTYDERDLLWKVSDAFGNTTEYTYDENGNLKEIKDANSNTTSYTYDDFDRLITTTYADLNTEEYSYDKASNLIQKVNRNNQTITYAYDELNRLTEKTTPEDTITYTYDAGSRLTDATDTNGTISYSYDALDRVVQTTQYAIRTTQYEYDTAGNRTKLTYPDSTYIIYEYDELNRLTSIKDQTLVTIASYSYDSLSRRTQLNYANSTQIAYDYDAINRLKTITNTYDLTPNTYSYTYDNVGNRLTKTDTSGTESYTYDDIYQLTNVTYPDTSSTTYNYDNLGNRTSTVNGGTTNYVPNNMNQYTSVGGVVYTYDNNGNLTSDHENTYTYDSENRLIEVHTDIEENTPDIKSINTYTSTGTSTYTDTYTYTSTGTSTDTDTTPPSLRGGLSEAKADEAIYAYDPFGRRTSKTVDGITTKYLYDGDQVICEYDNDTLLRKFIYGPGIDEPILMEDVQMGERYYYHFDGLGSVTALSDTDGNLTESYSYDIFGNITSSLSSVGNPYYFTGRRYDEETGLYYYRARYYDPAIGRFLQTDPIGYIAGINLYTYVGNNPVNWIDPFGLDKEEKSRLDRFREWLETHGYIDINITGGFIIGGTGGIQIDTQGDVHPYLGGGLVTPGVGPAVMWSPGQVTSGWSVAGQVVGGGAAQGGYSFGDGGGWFYEVGGGFSYPTFYGGSLTGYYVW